MRFAILPYPRNREKYNGIEDEDDDEDEYDPDNGLKPYRATRNAYLATRHTQKEPIPWKPSL